MWIYIGRWKQKLFKLTFNNCNQTLKYLVLKQDTDQSMVDGKGETFAKGEDSALRPFVVDTSLAV